MIIALIVIVVVVVLLLLYVIATYNGLVKLRNRVENAWAQIDVQLKRRLDLVPNLVETVKGYAAHERQTLDAVIQARNAGVAAQGPQQEAQASNMLTGALRQLFALSEAYPDLKANQNFLSLQEELTATEGPGGVRAAVLQRLRPGLQHQDPVVPGGHPGRCDEVHRAGVLRGRRGRSRSTSSAVLSAPGVDVRTDRRQQAAHGRPRRGLRARAGRCRCGRRPPHRLRLVRRRHRLRHLRRRWPSPRTGSPTPWPWR